MGTRYHTSFILSAASILCYCCACIYATATACVASSARRYSQPAWHRHLPAWFVYEHSPCSCCRFRALKLLASTGTLPPWIADEARLDANEEIRSLVLEHVAANGA